MPEFGRLPVVEGKKPHETKYFKANVKKLKNGLRFDRVNSAIDNFFSFRKTKVTK